MIGYSKLMGRDWNKTLSHKDLLLRAKLQNILYKWSVTCLYEKKYLQYISSRASTLWVIHIGQDKWGKPFFCGVIQKVGDCAF